MKEEQQRTPKQNNCLHQYCTELAESLCSAGFDQKAVISEFDKSFEIPWTMEAVKLIFKRVAKIMYDVESTTELSTTQIQRVYQVVDMRFSEITGITIEWPNRDRGIYG